MLLPVCNLYVYILLQPCYHRLLILPYSDNTSVVYPFLRLDGSVLNFFFFFFCWQTFKRFALQYDGNQTVNVYLVAA